MPKLPITVMITVKNEEKRLPACLSALTDFDEVIVIDSNSNDSTKYICTEYKVRFENFIWNGQYPKKRQWCLDRITTKHNWIFFVDADEIIPRDMINELQTLDFSFAGYFVSGVYVLNDVPLRFGLKNNKLCLFDKRRIMFPVVNDLDIDGMGEIEGHYQPILKNPFDLIGQIKTPLHHHAYVGWHERHERYANWEAEMILNNAYPHDPSPFREYLKRVFRHMPCRGLIAFIHSYIFKWGFLDGLNGFKLAQSRYCYYAAVARILSQKRKGRG